MSFFVSEYYYVRVGVGHESWKFYDLLIPSNSCVRLLEIFLRQGQTVRDK